METRMPARHQVHHDGPVLWVGQRRHVSARLIDQQVSLSLRRESGVDQFSADLYVMEGGIYSGPELGDHLAVESPLPVEYELFGGAPGRYSRRCDYFLQAFFHRKFHI